MKRHLIAATMIVATLGMAVPALAEGPTISANTAMTTEYFFRGISQTDDRPAIQGGFDYEGAISGDTKFYLGTWASNVNFNDANIEIDYVGGVRGKSGKLGWDVGLIYYSYPGADSSLDYNFFEVAGKVSYDAGAAEVTAGLNYSPENFGKSGSAVYAALDVSVPVTKAVSLAAHVGHQWIEDNATFGADDYLDYSIGVSTSAAGLDFDLSYTDTDLDGCDDACGAVVFTVSKSF